MKTIKLKLENVIKKTFNIEDEVNLSKPSSVEFGDFTSNICFILSKKLALPPLAIAEKIKKNFSIEENDSLESIEIVAPGFINFYMNKKHHSDIINNILNLKDKYGQGKKNKEIINIEYVSANPTGFLHVAHARGAALGDSLANIISFAGSEVIREYYINDAGSQINILAEAIYIRYQQELGKNLEMPEDTYRGDDIVWFAKKIIQKIGNKWADCKFSEISGEIKTIATEQVLIKIKEDLKSMGVDFDIWFSEKSMYKDNYLKNEIKNIKGTYEKDGALWMETTKYGDDKDRVLIKSDGSYTYFLPDIIYHKIKSNRNQKITKMINIWGADHSGYIKRMEIALELQNQKGILDVITIQLVKLLKDNVEVKMSKRKGTSLYLTELLKQVGRDSSRFYLVNRSSNSEVDFDLNLVNLKTNDNPLFAIQYAHARIHQLISKSSIDNFDNLVFDNVKEHELITSLEKFPDLIQDISKNYKVHLLTKYLIQLAREYNSFYSNNKIIGAENEKSLIALSTACGIILKNGLNLIGVSAPDRM